MDRYRVYLGFGGVWEQISLPGAQGDSLLVADSDSIIFSITDNGVVEKSGGYNLSASDTVAASITESPSMIDKAIPEETVSFEALDFESADFE